MLSTQPLDSLPIWGVYLLTVIVLYLSIEAGYRFGRFSQQRWPDRAESGVGSMVGASLAFLGFMLALITSTAMGIFNERRVLVMEEANAIGTTYLRADYREEPSSTDSRAMLCEYVEARLAAPDPDRRAASIARAEEIHPEFRGQVVTLARTNPARTTALPITSLNEVIELHSQRVNIHLGVRIPPALLSGSAPCGDADHVAHRNAGQLLEQAQRPGLGDDGSDPVRHLHAHLRLRKVFARLAAGLPAAPACTSAAAPTQHLD